MESKVITQTNGRIEWVDIFKALIVCSMVIGHATGLFNGYIYQFHMAAFFFVSGYTASVQRDSFFNVAWKKWFTLMLPFYTIFFLFVAIVYLLHKAGVYTYLFSNPYPGLLFTLQQFFNYGNVYIEWLGATWFIPVLYMIHLVQKTILIISKNQVNITYVIISSGVFLLGYMSIKYNYIITMFNIPMDLVFIGQFYFAIGLIVKNISQIGKIGICKRTLEVTIAIIAIAILYYFNLKGGNTVDYPSRMFGNPFYNVLGACSGIYLSYYISKLLTYLPNKIKKYVMLIGQNTLGILFLHFMMFKVGFLILYMAGIVDIGYFKLFLGAAEVNNMYWWLISCTSIFCSIILWNLLNSVNILKILLGKNDIYIDLKERYIK